MQEEVESKGNLVGREIEVKKKTEAGREVAMYGGR